MQIFLIMSFLTMILLIDKLCRNESAYAFCGFRKFAFQFDYASHFDSVFFVADDKTEDPTPKKLLDARKKGQVAKSTDLNSAIILLLMLLLLSFSAEYGFERLYSLLYRGLSNAEYTVSPGNLRPLLIHYAFFYFSVMVIVFGTVMVSGTIANLAQTGFLFSTEPLKPNIKKLNPIEGFKNLFSKKTLFNLAKTLLKFIFVGYVAYLFAKENLPKIVSSAGMELGAVFPFVKDLIYKLVMRVAAVLGVLAISDYVYQRYDFKKNLRMTKNEIKEEMKQMEGDPQIKSQRKQKQRQIAMSRMMDKVPEATLVLTNPTHLSIALRYDENKEGVPIVVAKGADNIAFKIKEIARANNVPIIENKPLARTLFKRSEVGEEIPADLYLAVAEILAIVYKTNKRKGK